MRLLLIEDEYRLAENVAQALREAGFAVDHAADGVSGSHFAEQNIYCRRVEVELAARRAVERYAARFSLDL